MAEGKKVGKGGTVSLSSTKEGRKRVVRERALRREGGDRVMIKTGVFAL